MSDSYFFLNADCFLVTGAVNAAIYHLSNGSVYSIDRCAREVLELTEQAIPLPRIFDRMTEIEDKNEIMDFLKKLADLDLANFSHKSQPPQKLEIQPISYELKKVWVELKESCNLRCRHCYADPSVCRSQRELNVNQWKTVISEAASLGAKWIQLIGGEPILYGKKNIFELITWAQKEQFTFIEIFTNGTLIDDECIDFFAKNHVNVALSIYSKRAEVHDEITQIPGSFSRTISNIKKLYKQGVSLRLGLVVMKQNCQYEEETLSWLQMEFKDIPVSSDVFRCTLSGRDQKITCLNSELWSRKLRIEPKFPKISRDDFVRNKFGHSCFQGELCIQADGAVYPCIMDREHCLGKVTESSLQEIMEGSAAQSIWNLSKDQIDTCRDCEYRYACFDCRPAAIANAQIVEQSQQDLCSKDPCCLYDPYTGQWGKANEFIDKITQTVP